MSTSAPSSSSSATACSSTLKLLLFLLTLALGWHIQTLPVIATAPEIQQSDLMITNGIDPFPAPLGLPLTSTTPLTPSLVSQGQCTPAEEKPALTHSSFSIRELISRAAWLTRTWLPAPTSTSEKRVNILLLGSDNPPGEKYGRTDTMILLTIDPTSKTAGMLSLPRDLWVTIPGYGENRLNYAYRLGEVKKYPGGGVALLRETIEANLGVTVDFYGMIEFEGFEQMVDTLGGIELCVPQTIDTATYYGYIPTRFDKVKHHSYVSGHGDGYLEYSLGFDKTLGHRFFYIEAGPQTLDGEAALYYVRTRATITADFARVRRQQEVLFAIRRKALQIGIIPKAPDLWHTMSHMIKTDLQLNDVVQLARLAYEIDPAQIRVEAIGLEHTIDYKTPGGAQVLLPDQEKINTLISDMFGASQTAVPLTQTGLETNATTTGQP